MRAFHKTLNMKEIAVDMVIYILITSVNNYWLLESWLVWVIKQQFSAIGDSQNCFSPTTFLYIIAAYAYTCVHSLYFASQWS
jgi:hypothetical protein